MIGVDEAAIAEGALQAMRPRAICVRVEACGIEATLPQPLQTRPLPAPRGGQPQRMNLSQKIPGGEGATRGIASRARLTRRTPAAASTSISGAGGPRGAHLVGPRHRTPRRGHPDLAPLLRRPGAALSACRGFALQRSAGGSGAPASERARARDASDPPRDGRPAGSAGRGLAGIDATALARPAADDGDAAGGADDARSRYQRRYLQ